MLTICSAIRQTQTPDGAVLLDIERGQMLCLNPVGSKILELVGSGFEEEEIASEVSALSGMNIKTVRTDVHEFLGTLTRHHVIERCERATGQEA